MIDLTNVPSVTPFDTGFDMQGFLQKAIDLPTKSWEYGTMTVALMELLSPKMSEFSSSAFTAHTVDSDESPALQAGLDWIKLGKAPDILSVGGDAISDPASLGPVAYLIGQSKSKSEYATAAEEQLEFLLNKAPRSEDGTISHRGDGVELWADFMFMAPPFIAYYGAHTENATLIQEAYDQSAGYHKALQTENGWKHIVGGGSEDLGLWATGNAWAAAGMARVLATMLHAPESLPRDETAIEGLTGFVKEIIDAAIAVPKEDGLVPNYMYSKDAEAWFGEVSGSALLAATAFRMAVLRSKAFGGEYVEWAEGMRKEVGRHVKDGVAAPAVNPMGWKDRKPVVTGSPEGQAFVVMMYAAWRDCIQADVCSRPT